MGFIYKNEKYIARILLIPVVFIFLLALNFKIWNVIFIGGNLGEIRVSQPKKLEYCTISDNNNNGNVKAAIQISQLFLTGFISMTDYSSLSLFMLFIWIYRSILSCNIKHTLISLRVRMDD